MFKHFLYLLTSVTILSCTTLKTSPKYELTDGVYKEGIFTRKGKRVYVETHENALEVYNAQKVRTDYIIDKKEPVQIFQEVEKKQAQAAFTFYKPSFDIDFLAIPLKYRPGTSGFPRQLNSNINGALYIGSRYDLYRVSYRKTPLGMFERDVNHFGFSVGFLNGLGSTAMNPWVTNYSIDSEYDGVVWSKGFAVILAFNKISAGIALGTDYLLDRNKQFWIYQDKLWIGLTLGLNLN